MHMQKYTSLYLCLALWTAGFSRVFSQYIGFPSVLTEVFSRKSAQIPDAVCPTRNSAESKRKQLPFKLD